MDLDNDSYTDAELVPEFATLFPQGFGGADVVREIAPDGWAASPLVAAFHPSVSQVYEEFLRMNRNIAALKRSGDAVPPPPEPTLEEIVREYRETTIEPQREVQELVGQCLWDIFSDGHEVVAADGRRLDLGSFRGSGGILADVLNQQTRTSAYDYLSFYMGTIWVSGRADLTPVYRMIFRRLRDRQLDWVYHFPRLYAIDMRPLKKSLDEQKGEPEWADYDPSKALAEQEK